MPASGGDGGPPNETLATSAATTAVSDCLRRRRWRREAPLEPLSQSALLTHINIYKFG